MRTALHTCCGPCASACVPVLRDLNHEVVLFFSNSNLDTPEEYERRLAAARALAQAEGITLVADVYDHADWLEQVAKGFEHEPEKGRRCARCYQYNLMRTAAWAKAHGMEAFTTSLTISPHKPSPVVFAAGDAVGKSTDGPAFLPIDFKKKNGFLRSLKRSAELGLYRQDYCGCEFSNKNRSEVTNI